MCDDLDAARSLADEAQDLVRETLAGEHFVAMIPALARARLLARTGEDGESEAARLGGDLGKRAPGGSSWRGHS